MLDKLARQVCDKLDSSPRVQKIIAITTRQEKIAQWIFLPALAAAAWLLFWTGSAEAAQPDPTKFWTAHEVKPLVQDKRDAEGQPVHVINQVDILIQLPGERVARRVRAPLQNTLFLDPRAPEPGIRTYETVIGLDGQLEENRK
ncbi:MAG: hypothetical protein ACYCWA_02495 [Thiobacillus sp.]